MKILLATYNKHKLYEIRELMKSSDIEIVGLEDMNYFEDIVEDGKSFIENALIKAETIYDKFRIPVLADDSGISIDALDGRPGIHSARFAGEDTDPAEKNKLIIEMLKGKKNRNAHYTCAIAYVDEREKFIVEKYCHGEIIDSQSGTNGFGYDPIFYIKEFGRTLAEISIEEKNKISHRGQALREFKRHIEDRNSMN